MKPNSRRPIGPVSLVAAVAFLAVAFLAPHRASAEARRVVVMPLSGSIPKAPEAGARLTQVLARAAGLTGNKVTIGEVSLEDAAAMFGCSDQTPDCLGRIASALSADDLVIGTAEPSADDATVTLVVRVFAGGAVREESFSHPVSDVAALVEAVARDASGMFISKGEAATAPEPAAEPAPKPAPAAPERSRVVEPPPPAQRDIRKSRSATPWLVAGVGGVAAGAGAVFLALGQSRQREVDDAPISTVEDFERLMELEDSGDRYLKIGSGLVIAGGAVLAAGGVWIIIDRMSGSESAPASMSLAPVLLDHGAGVVVQVAVP